MTLRRSELRVGGSASLAAADADEAGAGVIAGRFASGDFAVGLRVGHAGLNLVQDLCFPKDPVFFRRAICGVPMWTSLQTALQNKTAQKPSG